MSSTAETVLRALEGTHERRRGRNLQQIFATEQLSDAAVDAANRAGRRWEREYNSFFPAWAMYRRVVAGVGLYDGQLEGFAVWLAEIHANKINSRPAKSKPRWVQQAGRDALDYAICGRFAESLKGRAERFGVHWSTYRSIRNPVARYLWRELEAFEYLLHAEYIKVLRDQEVRAPEFHGSMDQPRSGLKFAQGCARTIPLKDMADAYRDQPETLYHGLMPTDWWDAAYARGMRKESQNPGNL